MRAWRVHEFGDPAAVMRREEVDSPRPGPGQVRVAVSATGLNFFDGLLCRGLYQERPPFPFTPGVEFCGRVVEGGEGVGDLPTGRVVGMAALPAGSLATEALADARMVFGVPDDMPDDVAAALAVNFGTSHAALHLRGRLQAGEAVLVHAGAGGVGSAAIQLAAAAGARVMATAGTPAKTELCRRLGAEVAIDYTTEDFVAVVRDATGGRGADLVVDPVGGDVFDQSLRCLAWEGRIVVVGFTSGRIPRIPANRLLLKNVSAVGLAWGAYLAHRPEVLGEIHAELVALWRGGRIAPLVGKVIPFDEAPRGIADLAARRTTGKVVVAAAG